MDMSNCDDDCREEDVDIKLHSIKVEEDDEYILGLEEDFDLDPEQDGRSQSKNIHSCNQCILQFQTRQELTTHQVATHPPPYVCSVCRKTRSSVPGFLKHVQVTCSDEVDKTPRYGGCTRCGKPFKTRTDRTCHSCAAKKKKERDKGKMECIQETFLTEFSPVSHEKNSSSSNIEAPNPSASSRTDKACQQCLVCGNILSSLRGGIQHVRQNHKSEVKSALASGMPSSVTCDECGRPYYDERTLLAHKRKKHTDKSPIE